MGMRLRWKRPRIKSSLATIRVPYDTLASALEASLLSLGVTGERGKLCARLFAETTRDGVYTHGLARFPRFAAMVRNGAVVPGAVAEKVAGFGAMERWNGRSGPGNLNAWTCMGRAMELAKTHGLGAVFLANTNHWMRGGTYGWQAADAGMMGICFTNTLANLPPWGAKTPALGNNPLVVAVPRAGGNVVLDMAMSQYSFGTLSAYEEKGAALPFPGGFDEAGETTTDAGAIARSGRALPIGLWKGSGLSMMLDLMAATLSGGKAVHEIAREAERETGLSQVFLAIDPAGLGDGDSVADAVVASLGLAELVDPARPVRYPGEETLRVRRENMELGVPVDEGIWGRLVGGGI